MARGRAYTEFLQVLLIGQGIPTIGIEVCGVALCLLGFWKKESIRMGIVREIANFILLLWGMWAAFISWFWYDGALSLAHAVTGLLWVASGLFFIYLVSRSSKARAAGGTSERRTILILFTTLMVLAFLLLYTILSQSAQVPPGPGPSVATDVGLLITVVLCVSISFWMTFADKKAKNWKKALLVVGLIYGSVVFFFLGVRETFGLMGVKQGYPAAFNNLSVAGFFLVVIAAILGLAAILTVILILDKYVAEADIKAETERHRLPTEDSP